MNKKEKVVVDAQENIEKIDEGLQTKESGQKKRKKEKSTLESIEKKRQNLQHKINSLEDKKKEFDMHLVTGTFKNFQSPNVITRFSKRKYPEEKITTYTMRDGGTYTVPYYVAEELRQESYYCRNARFQKTDGSEGTRVGDKVKLMDFFPHGEHIPGIDEDYDTIIKPG